MVGNEPLFIREDRHFVAQSVLLDLEEREKKKYSLETGDKGKESEMNFKASLIAHVKSTHTLSGKTHESTFYIV